MNKIDLIIFLAGAAIGSAATWLGLKKHYEKISQEEIDSVKATFSRKKEKTVDFNSIESNKDSDQFKANMDKLKPDLVEYATKIREQRYITDINKGDKDMKKNPYVISPDEYGEYEDDDESSYDLISLSYYSNGVLADDNDDVIANVDDIVGKDFADHFGEYEEDSVYIRNDRLKCDYEILKINRPYIPIDKEN